MNKHQALKICSDQDVRIRYNGMPEGDWIAYYPGSTVQSSNLWSVHTKAAADLHGGTLKVLPYYIYYSHKNNAVYMLQPDSIPNVPEWEIVK